MQYKLLYLIISYKRQTLYHLNGQMIDELKINSALQLSCHTIQYDIVSYVTFVSFYIMC